MGVQIRVKQLKQNKCRKGRLRMATKKELIKMLEEFDDDDIVVCMDENGRWDNIEEVRKFGGCINIIFGGGSPFSDE